MISGIEPISVAITGVPAAIASVITSPNGSHQLMGNKVAIALPKISFFCL